jgi:adenylate cyclase
VDLIPTMTPAAQEIRHQLDRILASEAFATAGRHSRLLRYLVERTLAGEGDQLKEYVLGSEVFDRDASYDPRLDSIVRVEVRRLRARLDEYYASAGATDPVHIRIPKGGYVPEFSTGPASVTADSPVGESDAPPVPARQDAGSRRPLTTMLIGGALALAVVILAAGVAMNQTGPARASGTPAVAVMPFEHYESDLADSRVVTELSDRLTVELARLGTVAVASRTSASRYAGERRSIREIAAALEVDFVIEGSVSSAGERVETAIRLVDGTLDRKVWVGEYTTGRSGLASLARTIARDVATAALHRANR